MVSPTVVDKMIVKYRMRAAMVSPMLKKAITAYVEAHMLVL